MVRVEVEPHAQRLTVHAVGRLTGSVMAYLLPLLRTLHARGDTQWLLYAPTNGEDAARLQDLPLGVGLRPVLGSGHQGSRALALARGLDRLLQQIRADTLHLHGLVPGLAFALLGSDVRRVPRRVLLAPHGSSRLPRLPLLRLAVLSFIRHRLREQTRVAVVTMPLEARWLTGFAEAPVQLLECPVEDDFFLESRRESKRALLLSSSDAGNERSLVMYVQLAVLLLDERLGLNFNWLGAVPERQVRACRAAGVSCFDDLGPHARVQRLVTCWIYVSLSDDGAYPQHLAEAMAVGVPCVALETDVTRGLVTDGEDGFLCVDVTSMLVRIAQLVDSPDLRARIGRRARETARRRLSTDGFRQRLDWILQREEAL